MLDLGLTILRVVVGFLFIGHGAQKLSSLFGGHGFRGTAEYFAAMGMHPAKPVALLVGLAELFGGLGLLLGLFTPLAATAITAVMLGAIVFAHWPRVWVAEGGFEYPLVNLAIVALFGLAGPGPYALDRVLAAAELLPSPETYLVGLLAAIAAVFWMAATRRPVARQGTRDLRAA